jgi:hypothetical protein
MQVTTEEAFETMFPMWSVQRLYNEYERGHCAGNKQRPHKIMRMNMFTPLDKVKPNTENKRGLSLVVVKLITVHVTKLPL